MPDQDAAGADERKTAGLKSEPRTPHPFESMSSRKIKGAFDVRSKYSHRLPWRQEEPTPLPNMIDPLKILIVDDDSNSADALSLLLAIDGHETRVADGGREALSVFRAFKPGLVICDIFMPSLDGFAFAQTVRSMKDIDQPVLVAFSGLAGMEDQRAMVGAGFDAFMAKPLDADRLADLVAACRLKTDADINLGCVPI